MTAIKTGLTAEQLMIPMPRELVAVKLKTSTIALIVIGIDSRFCCNNDH